MSKLSRIRIVNLNYNHDTINIDDKTFDLAGENTLISLRNGGGKSVLVQMLVSLFVNKTYRDFADREFKTYFNTNKPTFLMTEWQLDSGSSRFLAGMMVRKNQKEENEDEDLELFTFTGSYETGCRYDLDNIPIVKMNGNYKMLRGFAECKNILEEISREKEGDFRLYDMAGQYARNQYFKTLKQYQIHHKEWESIIRKVNQKESGLSELFQNAKDEKNLVENWFLKPIEDKLNQDKNKIEEFRKLTFQFIEQYKKNQSNIVRKAMIEKYFEDTQKLKEHMEHYAASYEEQKEVTAEMVLYIQRLREAIEKITAVIAEKEEQLITLQEAVRQIIYEQISYDIYMLQEQKQETVRERYEQEVLITGLTKAVEDMEGRLLVFDCSRIYEELQELKLEKAETDEKLQRLYEDADSSKHEIEKIGSMLSYLYRKDIQKSAECITEKEQEYRLAQAYKKEMLSDKNRQEKQIQETEKNIGKLEYAVSSYQETEDRFNQDYQCDCRRNIVGLYPDGFLEVKASEMDEETQQEQRKLAGLSRKKLQLETKRTSLYQEEKIASETIQKITYKIQALNEKLTVLEGEKEERIRILKYIGMQETDIDKKVLILDQIDKQMKKLELAKNELIAETAEIKKQYRQLKEGKTVELPEHISAYFKEHGIEIVYGMEWLKKNGRGTAENAALVAQNPFIPYAVIMEKDAFERLENLDEELYTSFPIPVIVRSELEKEIAQTQTHIHTYGNIHFFVMFNHHLLDKEKLAEMLSELEKKLAVLEKKLVDRTADINTFAEYRMHIENQSYSIVLYNNIQEEREAAVKEKETAKARQDAIKTEKELLDAGQKELSAEMKESEQKIRFYESRKKEFERLCDKYVIYESDRKSLVRTQEESETLKRKQKELEKGLAELEETLTSVKELIRQQQEKQVQLRKKAAVYEAYTHEIQNADSTETTMDKDLLEARYKALTQKISEAAEELKARQEKLVNQIEKKKAELERKNKLQLLEDAYRGVSFHEEQYTSIEHKIKKTKIELNAANEQNVRYGEKIATFTAKIEHLYSSLVEKTKKDEPVSRELIVDTDFEKRITLKKYDAETAEKVLRAAQGRKNELTAFMNGVSEFSDDRIELTDEKRIGIEGHIPDLELAERRELDTYQKELRKRIRTKSDALTKERSDIFEEIKLISTKEIYTDDYFAKPFLNLLSQAGNPHQLIRQYEINCSAYVNHLEKLKVDLEMIDKEQKNMEEMFLEYLADVNANIAMIDKNSTITVRGRSIKMLRIQVPDWESEKEYFRIRLHDFFAFIVKRGIEILEEKKNLMEYLGNAISTKKLYDDVVGIKNIKIKLYKIEEEREIPITWAEVSANSGGEGFLSAFVILTCLLSYMRRDENDMFTNGEEGKVLIMDNPFAQTYSVHLLKPLMEMAKKTNTQLICLSGLGGDAIYNRFDNIYVIRLMDSNIRNGVQRLESHHIKGTAVKKMVLSEFKTE